MEAIALEVLPAECLVRVFSFLPPSEVVRISSVSKQFHNISNESSLWCQVYRTRWLSRSEEIESKYPTWKERFFFRIQAGQSLVATRFSENPEKALEWMVSEGILKDHTSQSIAEFFASRSDLNPLALGLFLSQCAEIANLFIERVVPLQELEMDEAIRLLMKRILMPSMAGRVSRLLEAFAEAFWRAQQTSPRAARYGTSLQCFVLAYSIILLNVDLHNPCIKSKITKAEWVRNSNSPLPAADMFKIYDRIAARPLLRKPEKEPPAATSWWERIFS